MVDFASTHDDLLNNINYNLSPNVTWVEVIEETLAFFGRDFDVHDFLFEELYTKLRDTAENHTRNWLIKGLGVREYIWDEIIYPIYETYFLPIILDIVIPNVIDGLWTKLNDRVQWERGPINKLKDRFNDFMNNLGAIDKEGRRSSFKNFTKMIGAAIRLSVSSFAYLLYMNATQIEEYIQGVYNSVEDYAQAWNNFGNWIASGPWLEPISINGSITNSSSGAIALRK